MCLPSVTNDDLRRVLVWHDDGWAGESAPVSVWMVPLEGLPSHACVLVRSQFEVVPAQKRSHSCRREPFSQKNLYHLLRHGSRFARTSWLGLGRSSSSCRFESQAHMLTVLHQYSRGRCHSGILEVYV